MCCKYFPLFAAQLLLLVALWEPCHSLCAVNEVFEEHPSDEQVMAGETVIFTCSYAVQGRFWSWEFHQQGGNRITITGNDTSPDDFLIGMRGELVLPIVRSNHTGDYQCHVTPTQTCSVFSENASLTVIGPPNIVLTSSSPICHNTTDTAVISGQVSGHPLPFIHFYQRYDDDDMAVVVNSRVNITQPTDDNIRFSISFNNLLTSDAGTYVVQANNSIGFSQQHVFELRVKGPDLPEINVDRSPYLIQRLEARVPQVTCSIQESANTENGGQATMRWEGPNSSVVREASNVVELELSLESFDSEEEGVYTCTATNVRGDAEPVSVHVYAPISLTNPPTVTDIDNDRFKVSWTEPLLPPGVPVYMYIVYVNRDSGSTYRTYQTLDLEFTIDTTSFDPGDYEVKVAVVLGDENSAATGEGTSTAATASISISAPSPSTSSTLHPPPSSPSLLTLPTSSSPLPPPPSLPLSPSLFTPTPTPTPPPSPLTPPSSPTSGGTHPPTAIIIDAPSTSSLSLLLIVGVVVAGVVILFIVGICIGLFFLCYYYPHRRKLSSQQQSWSKENRLDETDQTMGNSYEPLHIPHSELPPSPGPHNGMVTQYFNTEIDIDPKWEFSRGNLKLSEVLCESRSTILYKATAEGIRDKPIDVSVKALRDTATDDEAKVILYEMDQLSSLGDHPNLVSLLRVCTVEQPLYMVMEYMCHGDLLGFLRASRGHYGMYTVNPGIRNHQPPNLQLSSRDLLSIGGKVANGMRFLADRKIVHRALCCKNVLVGAGLDIKINNIGGFDLREEVRIPLVKWFSPEVLKGENFSIGSDVWAFGVTLWEIVTVGATPYAEMNSTDLFSQLYSGYRMPRPPHCGQDVYDMMMHCWAYSSGDRPHFATIHEQLDGLAHSKMSLLDLRSYNERAYSHFDECPTQATAL